MNSSACKVAFLDRDGSINLDQGYVYRLADWELIDHAAEAIALLRCTGFRIAVVTNQSGITSSLYTETDVDLLHAQMRRQLAETAALIDAVAFCPHSSDGDCECRKPKVGMTDHIARQLKQPIDCDQSWTIGDKVSDVGFGAALGTRTALIRSRYWREDELPVKPTMIVDSLYEAAVRINGATQSDEGDNRQR